MKVVLLVLLVSVLSLDVSGQNTRMATPFPPQPASEQTLLLQPGLDAFNATAAIANADIYYYDSTKKGFVRQFPMTSQGLYFISQRFTSPSPKTYLDSVTIFFPTIATGDVRVDAYRDTTLPITVGGTSKNFHLPNVYVQNVNYIRFDTARILFENIEAGEYQSVPYSGRLMSEEFHLQMSARRRSDLIDPAFTLRMSADSLVLSDLNPENSRLCFVLIDGSTGVYWERTGSVDALFAPNIDMFASVHYDDATNVGRIPAAEDIAITGLYPHPVSRQMDGNPTIALRLNVTQTIAVTVYDVMGRKVRTVFDAQMPAGNQLMNIPIAGLRPGTYMVRMQGVHTVSSRTLVILQ